MSKIRIGVIFGGKSGEHEVSLMSATSVIRAIDPEKFQVVMLGITRQGQWLLYEGPLEALIPGEWQAKAEEDLRKDPAHFSLCILGQGPNTLSDRIDFALPILHGPNGEDGTVQGLLELLNIPYGGCGVLGAATAMDKVVAKKIFEHEGLRQAPCITFNAGELEQGTDWILDRVKTELGYPVFVKPSNMGSSVGISKVTEPAGLPEALWTAAAYDERLIIEKGIHCRELETAVLGNYELTLGAVGEILPAAEYYDYKSKYFDAASKICIPADIPSEKKQELQDMAARAYLALGCQGYARVDFLMDRDTMELYINEINAIPGFTHASMFPLLCMDIGMTYPEIIERIVELGYERYHVKNKGDDRHPSR
ncbi:MAG TPA: D-alanine--D-alanine ligase A [Clostridiales bacterium]|nr:D-alanine--D-alanine ligase A [Clostridiales bacterium]